MRKDRSNRHQHPDLQRQIPVKLRAAVAFTSPSGVPEVASRRGWHMGIHEAYLVLVKKYPIAARYLLRHFHMTAKGDLGG